MGGLIFKEDLELNSKSVGLRSLSLRTWGLREFCTTYCCRTGASRFEAFAAKSARVLESTLHGLRSRVFPIRREAYLLNLEDDPKPYTWPESGTLEICRFGGCR